MMMQQSSPDLRERRGAHRVQVNLPARYASEVAHLTGCVSNLSRSGLFLRSQYLDEHGTEVDVSFDLPGEKIPVAVRGRVVRVNDGPLCPGMAIHFTRVPDLARRRLTEFMARRGRKLASS